MRLQIARDELKDMLKNRIPLRNLQTLSENFESETKPRWMKLRFKEPSARYKKVREMSSKLSLATVCQEAMCPNINECWGTGTATFMIMGDTCTRACRFCNVNHGKPGSLDKAEPEKLADAIQKLGLDYVVLTSVDRDDLPDSGAGHFAECIRVLKEKNPKLLIEILTPDFCGKDELIQKVLDAAPTVFGHNIETVMRLQKVARDFRANYSQSLHVLDYVKKSTPEIYTKSGIMVGLGEEPTEVIKTMRDLRKVGVDFLTIGQYLRPSAWNLKIVEYVTPEQFEVYEEEGLKMGFKYVAAGSFVRSSYRAGELFIKNVIQKHGTD
ncbi:MAG: lipoyl synthase [Patescibacteria group bacterium]